MLRLPDRLSPLARAAAVAAALIGGGLIAFADRYVTRMQLAPLEILPLAILAWMVPLAVSLPASIAIAFAVALEEYAGGYHVAGESLFEVTLSVSIAYVSCVILVSMLRSATARSVATSQAQYRAIGDAIPYGVWSASPAGDMQYVSPSYLALIGDAERDLAFAAVREECKRAPREPFEFEHEHRSTDGKSHWILTRGVPILGGGQAIQSYVGINLDITERKHSESSLLESEGRYRYLAESIPQIVWICDSQARIEYFNERWYAFSGMRRGQPIRGAFGERLHRADAERSFLAWVSPGRDGHETYESEVRLRGSDGSYRWFLSRALAQTDREGNVIRWFGTSTDIDARKRAQDQLAFLARAGESLTETLDVESTCNVLARLAVPILADWCGVFLLEGDDKIRTAALAHDGDEAARERAWVMERRYGRTLQSTGIIAAAMRTGEVQSAPLDDPIYRGTIAQDETHSRLLQSLDFGAAIAVPMRSGLRTIGAILLIRRESGRNFEPDDYELARELSRRASVSVENARAYDRERRVADALQAAFLPSTLPKIPGLSFDAVYVPGADESAIGGDWYDAFQLSDGRIALSIGDVAGRGLRAAVVMGRVREAIRAFALEGLEPAAILAAAQRVLRLSEVATMVTAFVAIADPRAHTLMFANAGHPPAMLATAGGIQMLVLDGIPLGIFDEIEPQQKVVAFPDDALLVLYTDGLIEIDRDVVTGMQYLRDAITSAVDSGERTATAIYHRLVDKRPARDDVAMLTVATQRPRREPLTLDLPAVPESARLVRAALQRFSEAYALDDDQRFTLEVAVGEAVANAIEHAYGIGAGRFAVEARENGSDLEIEVADQGQWRAPREEGRGRGTPIMQALSQRLNIENTAAGTTVHMSFTGYVERRTAS